MAKKKRTFADDGDPLDVLVICSVPIHPMTLIQAYPVGNVRMIDGGKLDDKIIAIPFSDPNYNIIKSIDELPKHIFDEMTHFFSVYKTLENKTTVIDEAKGREEAERIIEESIERYKEYYGKYKFL